ncbi:hypothetical protein IAT40_005235 [Kwoniella sp. CBS 6097]
MNDSSYGTSQNRNEPPPSPLAPSNPLGVWQRQPFPSLLRPNFSSMPPPSSALGTQPSTSSALLPGSEPDGPLQSNRTFPSVGSRCESGRYPFAPGGDPLLYDPGPTSHRSTTDTRYCHPPGPVQFVDPYPGYLPGPPLSDFGGTSSYYAHHSMGYAHSVPQPFQPNPGSECYTQPGTYFGPETSGLPRFWLNPYLHHPQAPSMPAPPMHGWPHDQSQHSFPPYPGYQPHPGPFAMYSETQMPGGWNYPFNPDPFMSGGSYHGYTVEAQIMPSNAVSDLQVPNQPYQSSQNEISSTDEPPEMENPPRRKALYRRRKIARQLPI